VGDADDGPCGEGCWLAWGDDAGFLRFQRFNVDGFNATAEELIAAADC
jgi:hypothetical protein